MARLSPELAAHQEWLGQIQPVGLVVSASVLVKQNVFVDRQEGIGRQLRLRELVADRDPVSLSFAELTRDLLDWPESMLAGSPGGPELPEALTVALPEYNDHLSPTFTLPNPDALRESDAQSDGSASPSAARANDWLALIVCVPDGADLDRPRAEQEGWRASPHARLERLLRETGVPVGLLFNGTSVRLVYAPRGESSGHLTFLLAHLAATQGRPMVSALWALLGVQRVTDVLPDDQRLLALLRESRRYQNEVSTALAGQVLEALWELLRGFQRADDASKGDLLRELLREDPHEVYGGLLTTLMRLVFILYAEDRGLMPAGDVYQGNYSLSGLFSRLREEQARYPDTMDARYGAWAHLLTLFRLIHDGGGHGDMRFPARHGRLFNPDAYPFLEGRPLGSVRQLGETLEVPRVPDGTIFRVLHNLLILEGERLSYRALDVEQIGSVYEAMMGFALETAAAPSIAVTPKHIVVNLEELLAVRGKDRAAWLKKTAELQIGSDALAKAASAAELAAALAKRTSRYTPQPIGAGGMYLQPTEERRRSGSHYTPRSLTEPIVRTTLRPVLERLGEQATPDDILALRVCDPAMGSGAFLVETCRLLGERLVKAWEVHRATPKVPDDEDVLTHARRLVAERCLYGVDKNIFAVDLAKLSIWLATLARDHPFTFLDHALRHGDSLVGLTREQIACLHWKPGKQLPLIRGFIDERVAEAQRLREQIQTMGSSDDVPEKSRLLRDAESAIAEARLIGDVVVSAFFGADKPKSREALRTAYAGKIETWLAPPVSEAGPASPKLAQWLRASEGGLLDTPDLPIPVFHWELEFPEVFTRTDGGFDAFVGNPPFLGGKRISTVHGTQFRDWLGQLHEGSSSNADLAAHFYRRAFNRLSPNGAFGLIATNTIAQGDTRGTGLRWIRHHGGTIFAARKRVKWPGAAAVIVSVVHVARGPLAGPYDLDGRRVDRITAFLFHAGSDDDPVVLRANAGKSFIGCFLRGMGFTFDDTDKSGVANPISLMHDLISKHSRNAERIFPYIGGEEVNDSPTHAHHRFVINFEQFPLKRVDVGATWADADDRTRQRWLRAGVVPLDYRDPVAADWPALLTILTEKVKPERERLGSSPIDVSHKERWWRFANDRPELSEAVRGLTRVFVLSRVSQWHGIAPADSSLVFSERLVVLSDSGWAFAACIQGRVHELWALFFGSTHEDRPMYAPADCFETFPFPFDSFETASPNATHSGHAFDSPNPVPASPTRSGQAPDLEPAIEVALEAAGREYYDFRAALMVRNNEGLTKTYNRFHDRDHDGTGVVGRNPAEVVRDIERLRHLHDAMDRAVLDAYGWTDIRPMCQFILDYEDDDDDTPGERTRRRKPWRYRWPDDVRDDVLARLLDLNAKRAHKEALAAAAEVRATPPPGRARRGKPQDTPLLD